MRFLRMKPGHGEVLIAEGDVEIADDEHRLIEEFRRQLDSGLWAAVPVADEHGRREARMVRSFTDVPRDADRVIFFPRAAGGR
ncbi:MAG: hypothetical protein ACYDHH_14015 [Solirubrobacteraceae bacterium]